MNRILILASTFLLLAGHGAQAWQGSPSSAGHSARRGAISGRVMADGQPLAYATVSLSKYGPRRQWRTVSAGEDGQFKIDDLEPGLYNLGVIAPGYIPVSTSETRRTYRIGDRADLMLMRGGVITGTVTDAAGEPIVAASVRAFRVRDLDGNPSSASTSGRRTDDRGVYRIYGLQPGRYIVGVGGTASSSFARGGLDRDAPTYHPSSTRATAQEVIVQAGAEVTGIDIRHRAEPGYTISGKLTGAIQAGGSRSGTVVSLIGASGTHEADYFLPPGGPAGFEFYGVADGDYFVQARREPDNPEQSASGAVSQLLRVQVRGADVSGLTLTLVPDASLAGRITLEPAREADLPAACRGAGAARADEALIQLHRDMGGDATLPADAPPRFGPTTVADERGDFMMANLEPGRYHLDITPPDDRWYVRGMTINQPPGPAADAGRAGLLLKSAQRLAGLTVTLAPGAAALAGRVLMKTPDEALPARLRLHLVPADPELRDQPLRFYEASVEADGSFTLKNLAPGRYYVLAQPAQDKGVRPGVVRLAAWDSGQRQQLQKRAAAVKQVIDLPPCGRVEGLPVVFSPQPAAPPQRPRK